jgi:hypothetical protein
VVSATGPHGRKSSVGIVRSRTEAMELLLLVWNLLHDNLPTSRILRCLPDFWNV